MTCFNYSNTSNTVRVPYDQTDFTMAAALSAITYVGTWVCALVIKGCESFLHQNQSSIEKRI